MPAEVLQAITAVKNSIDAVKLIKGYADEIKDIQKRGELMRIIGELSMELAEAQIHLAQLKIENYEMTQQIEGLQKEIEDLNDPRAQIVVKDGLYYKGDGDGPFCTGCYDTKKYLVRLKPVAEALKILGDRECPVCETKY